MKIEILPFSNITMPNSDVIDPFATKSSKEGYYGASYLEFMTNLNKFMFDNNYCAINQIGFNVVEDDNNLGQMVNSALYISPRDFRTENDNTFFLTPSQPNNDFEYLAQSQGDMKDFAQRVKDIKFDCKRFSPTLTWKTAETIMGSSGQDPLSFVQSTPYALIKIFDKWYLGQVNEDKTFATLFSFVTYNRYFNYVKNANYNGANFADDMEQIDSIGLAQLHRPTPIVKRTFDSPVDVLTEHNPVIWQMALQIYYDQQENFEQGFYSNTVSPDADIALLKQMWDKAVQLSHNMTVAPKTEF